MQTNPRGRRLPLTGLVSAEVITLLGNQVAVVAIPVFLFQQTGSPGLVALANAVTLIPILLAAALGGSLIDRWGAWRMSLLSDLLSGASVLLLPVLFLTVASPSPLLWVPLIFLGSLFDPTGVAARQTLVPGLARVARIPLEKVNTVRGTLENAADFAGPLVGAGLIVLWGETSTLFVNAASFLLCALVFVLFVPRKRRRSVPTEAVHLTAGLREIVRNPTLRTLALGRVVSNFVLLPFLGLFLPIFATQSLDNPALLGVALSVFGLSATVGAIAFPWLGRLLSRSALFYSGLAGVAVALLICGVALTPATLLLACGLGGFLLGAGNPLEQTILQEEIPPEAAGRVYTSFGAVSFASGPLGLLFWGVALQWTATNPVTLAAGSFLGVAVVLGWVLLPLVALPKTQRP